MNRRSILFLVVIALVFIAVLLYFIPFITPVALKLEATKVDDQGNELGSVQIIINGSKLDYLFKPSRIDVSFHPFDGITGVGPSNTVTKFGEVTGMIRTLPHRDYFYAYYGGVSERNGYPILGLLGFSPDMTKWIYCDDVNSVYYVASTDGSATAQELIQYFNGLTSSIPQTSKISLQTKGAEVDAQGNIIAEGEFILQAQYQTTADNKITFELTHLELPNLKVLKPGTAVGDPAIFMSYSDNPDLLVTTYSLVLPHPNGKQDWEDTVIVFVYTNTDFNYFLFTYKDSKEQMHYYIGAESDAPDYKQILTLYELLEN